MEENESSQALAPGAGIGELGERERDEEVDGEENQRRGQDPNRASAQIGEDGTHIEPVDPDSVEVMRGMKPLGQSPDSADSAREEKQQKEASHGIGHAPRDPLRPLGLPACLDDFLDVADRGPGDLLETFPRFRVQILRHETKEHPVSREDSDTLEPSDCCRLGSNLGAIEG